PGAERAHKDPPGQLGVDRTSFRRGAAASVGRANVSPLPMLTLNLTGGGCSLVPRKSVFVRPAPTRIHVTGLLRGCGTPDRIPRVPQWKRLRSFRTTASVHSAPSRSLPLINRITTFQPP